MFKITIVHVWRELIKKTKLIVYRIMYAYIHLVVVYWSTHCRDERALERLVHASALDGKPMVFVPSSKSLNTLSALLLSQHLQRVIKHENPSSQTWTISFYLISLWAASKCHSELGVGTLYFQLWITIVLPP